VEHCLDFVARQAIEILGTSLAIGLPAFAITIVSPAAARSTSSESLVLAS